MSLRRLLEVTRLKKVFAQFFRAENKFFSEEMALISVEKMIMPPLLSLPKTNSTPSLT
jgi:hypothetical protein